MLLKKQRNKIQAEDKMGSTKASLLGKLTETEQILEIGKLSYLSNLLLSILA